ncbi:MAG: PQQ-dependent dehydrogenase, methanol/ethanol family [Proteobacteria bacterium]|nr:PQQ-dependent dehydrogenase, methanol/ethanol family [Pseudomonadota bacterium]
MIRCAGPAGTLHFVVLMTVLMTVLIGGCSQEKAGPEQTGKAIVTASVGLVDDARIIAADDEPEDWLSYGRSFSEQRHSPLTSIKPDNVRELGVAWFKELNTTHALEATPLIVDGVMYFTSTWNIAHALDAATGAEIWQFDPKVPGETARQACCGVISRGLAIYEGRVYLATLDGRLLALDAASGSKVWEIDTIIDRSRDYTITGAPRVAAGKVFIGNGGAEYGVRGYVSAYDAASGDLVWRFFTVPGDPSQPFEHPEMELAASTWKGGEWWKIGGGGTVWNSIVYDPDFNTLYLGVGNGTPWTRAIRSPGGGDNLFLASIVAVDADSGRMKWYYQTTPGDNWDYTAVQDIMLADMHVDGADRKVLMQAPKNGFFYVIDRADGKLLRAHPYGAVTWATHVDLKTGRPVENTDKAYADNPQWILPGPSGAHNWQAMSYDASRGLVYFPSQDMPFLYAMPEEYKETGTYKFRPGTWNTAVEFGRLNQMIEAHPEQPVSKGFLTAFDPLTGQAAWRVTHVHPWNGGALSTATGLVFQGDALGNLSAYDSDSGDVLWQFNTYTSIVAPPVSYSVAGRQYVAVMVGSGINGGEDTEPYLRQFRQDGGIQTGGQRGAAGTRRTRPDDPGTATADRECPGSRPRRYSVSRNLPVLSWRCSAFCRCAAGSAAHECRNSAGLSGNRPGRIASCPGDGEFR